MSKARIFIVEGEAIVAEDMEMILGEMGYDVVGRASSAEDAVQKAMERRPDLILMDIDLRGERNGIDASREIKEKMDVPVLFLTAHADSAFVDQAKSVEPYAYIVKPFHERQLLASIEMALHKSRMERQLKESEKRYYDLFEHANDLIQSVTPDGHFLYVNKAWREVLGYSEEEVSNLTIWDVIHPDSIPHCKEIFRKAMSGKAIQNVASVFVAKNGRLIAVEGNVNCRMEEGTPTSTRGIFRDVTEHKKAEEAVLRLSKDREEIFQALGNATIILDPDFTIIDANRAVVAATGKSKTDLLGKKCCTIFHGTQRPPKNCPTQQLLSSARYAPVEREIEALGGTFLASCTPVLDEAGHPMKIIHTLMDITEHKRSEERIRESEEKYRTLIEHIQDGVFIIQDREIKFVNEAFANIAGCHAEEIVGRPFVDFVAPEDRKRFMNRYVRGMTGKKVPAQYQVHVLKKDEVTRRVVTIAASRITYHGKPAAMGAVKDITEREQMEEALRQSEEHLRRAQKMEAVGQLAGGIAHDFNNLLTAIQGYASLALMRIKEGEPLHEDLGEISKACERAINLSRQLLMFSRRLPIEMIPMDLNKAIQDFSKMLGSLIGEHIALSMDLDPDLWTAKADIGSIEQILMNLVVNAQHAMPEGGTIAVRTQNVSVNEVYCETHSDARPGRFICFTIQDSGVGMDQATIGRIFEPFFSTKGVGSGTGLGLAVVYGIIEQHEGWIRVESEPGHGATFEVFLPAFSEIPEEEQVPSVSLEAFRGEGERILVVEDDPTVRKFATKVLSGNGYVVFTAEDMQEAMDLIEKEKANFDLLFCDVVLPDGKGPEIMEYLHQRAPGIGVLFTSGYSDEESDWRSIREKGYPYLPKPFSFFELLKGVNDTLKERG